MHFWDNESGSLKKGAVHVNDPFLRQVAVQVPEDSTTFNVTYGCLRDGPAPAAEAAPDAGDEEESEEASTSAAPPAPAAPKRTRKQEAPEEDLGQRLRDAASGTEGVPLTYVPCENGIVMVGMIAIFSGEDYRVSRYLPLELPSRLELI